MQRESVIELKEEVVFLKSELDRLKGIILLLKRDKFGAKSERVVDLSSMPLEQLVFNEFEKEAALPLPAGEYEAVSYKRKKGRAKRKPFPEHLPREEKIIDLSDDQKVCPHDQTPLKQIGEERTEKLKAVPAQFSVLVEVKKKYACPCCDSYLAQPKVSALLPGTIATPDLLSYITFSKFFQALPLYRIEEHLKLNKIELKRGTMARWLIQLQQPLMPIYNLLQDMAFESGYMAIDATGVQVLKEPGRAAESKSSMWVRGSPERGIVLFDYDVSGGGKIARSFMQGFKGALQADAHRGYGALDPQGLTLLGCMMHSRRRFHSAYLIGGEKPGLAADAIAMFKWLYDKEADYKERGLTPAQRKEIREKEIRPSLLAIKEWAESKIAKVQKSTPLGNALNYYVNEYTELTAFLSDGRYEMDNGWVERMIKKFAIGRNNWLFCDTVPGAQASSMLYSLMMTAKLNGKDPYMAMTEVFTKLPHAKTAEDYEALTLLLLSPANPLSCHKKEG